ncbi:MAG TPA: ribonuclease HI [Candidatus Kapabacteria bacterium]|nr:ribonuclease HI [Candidatus Kapabacteria bacterium]
MSSSRPNVIIYTDGACSGNPGPGGYGAVMLAQDGKRLELSHGYKNTTNNRMELLAVIAALEALKRPCNVTLYSDSQYVVKAIEEGWLRGWQAKGWKKADKKPVLNQDLWKRLIPMLAKHTVKFVWTKGHAGNVENERCDVLAVTASQQPDLEPDLRGDEVQLAM